jgi:endonuclease/exonuclease/phosphatase family metal-dependent hydrolase
MLNKFMRWGSRIAAIALLLTFVVPYLAPERFPTLSLASLAVSPLILINVLFLIYWIFRQPRNAWFSGLMVLIAFFHFGSLVEFSSEGDANEFPQTLSLLSYNVRLFNAYEKKPDTTDVTAVIASLLSEKKPDVVCIQEYYKPNSADFSSYPFKFIHFREGHKLGHAIFSKYPIINKGAFDFEGSYNNTIYADILKGNDTLRIYNLHLQSMGILPNVEYLQDGDTELLRMRMTNAFQKQQLQLERIMAHKKTSPYPVLLCGDLNNTSFSYIYKILKDGMQDAFLERGNGIGKTFSFMIYPMRIDYIFAAESFEVIQFETLDASFSDHRPVSAVVGWPVLSDE